MSKAYYTPEPAKPQTASVGTFKPVGLESDAIIQRVSKDLYASPASGVRELLANEIRAAIKAKEGGADPRIEVTITDGTIRVWGIDSLGMEKDIFDTVYTTLGRSSNFDGKTAGQFGLGRAAYVTISDHVLLETSHRNGDRYSVLGVEGRGYQTGLPEPDIPYGTRVTMAPRDDYTDDMVDMVRDTAKRSPIPIRLITEDGTEELTREPLALDDGCLTADLPEAEFAVSPSGSRETRAYLCGIPIKFQYRGAYGIRNLAIDVHDEREFPPTPDRERMTEKAEHYLSGMIDAELTKRLDAVPTDTAEALDHPDLTLAIAFQNTPLTRHVMTRIPTYGRGKHALAGLTGRPILNCKTFNIRQINAVRKVHPDAEFVKDGRGLPNITGYMRANKIKPEPAQRTEKPDPTVVIHGSSGPPTRIDPKNPPKGITIYKVDGGDALYAGHPVLAGHDAALTIYNVKGVVVLSDAGKAARARAYQTSNGRMTGQEILKHETVYGISRPTLVECWGDGPIEGVKSLAVVVESPREYAELSYQSRAFRPLYVAGLGSDERVIETYMRLENPLHKNILLENSANHRFCDKLMEAEGRALADREPGEPEESPTLTHTYQTSLGEMTGRQILDSRRKVYPVNRQSLADCWGDGPEVGDVSMAVVIDEDSVEYRNLARMSGRVERMLWIGGLGNDQRLVESYLRLESPLYRGLLLLKNNRVFCDEFMRAENKEPIPHVKGCRCDECY